MIAHNYSHHAAIVAELYNTDINTDTFEEYVLRR